jgi:hypothetical protein
VQNQKLLTTLALFLGRIVIEKFDGLIECEPTWAYQFLSGELALGLEHEKIIGVLDEIPLQRRGSVRDITKVPD